MRSAKLSGSVIGRRWTLRPPRLTLVVGAFLAVLLVAAALGGIYAAFYADRLYPGVILLNANLGGQDGPTARRVVSARVDDLVESDVKIRYGERTWTSKLGTMGLRYDIDKMLAEATAVGRRGNILVQFGERLRALISGYRIQPAIWFDKEGLEMALRQVAAEIDRPPVDAALEAGPDQAVRIKPSQIGLAVDVAETARRFESTFVPFITHELDLVVKEIEPRIVEADLAEARAAGEAIIAGPITLRAGDKTWSISQSELVGMLTFPQIEGDERVIARLDSQKLADRLKMIAAEVNRNARDASLKYSDGQVVVVEGEEGVALDIEASVAAINAQAPTGQHTFDLVSRRQRPAIMEDDLREARSIAERMISQPLTLQYGSSSWTLSRAELGELLVFEAEQAAVERKIMPSFDRDALRGLLARIGQRIERPAKDARFRFQSGQLSLLSESVDGIELDVERTLDAVIAQTRQGNHAVDVVTRVQRPKVRSSDRDKIVIRDLLKEASTSYAGSIPERKHNVELAASRLDGVVVPPGETFSMNEALGPATLAAGFKIGYGITVRDGEMVTVPSEAGGICQVATTLYHAAFWAGLQIVQRTEHMYWISRYGQPPLGMKGLDATVDAPYVDLKFRNNTGNWIAIQARTDGSNVYFSIYGTRTGWDVKVDGPVISNIVPADQTMVYEEDPTIPWGREILVEHAEDGFTAAITRTVYKDGAIIDRYVSVSRYRPSRNVTLVGTKGRPAQANGQNTLDSSSPSVGPATE